MAYIMPMMEFIETPTFTRLLTDLLTDDEYAGLQSVLVDNPERGDIVKSGGGSVSCVTRYLEVVKAVACALFITGFGKMGRSICC